MEDLSSIPLLPTAKMQKAVELLFFDRLPDKEIAANQCGIARATLANWKNLTGIPGGTPGLRPPI